MGHRQGTGIINGIVQRFCVVLFGGSFPYLIDSHLPDGYRFGLGFLLPGV
jgi:hypothetical protein